MLVPVLAEAHNDVAMEPWDRTMLFMLYCGWCSWATLL